MGSPRVVCCAFLRNEFNARFRGRRRAYVISTNVGFYARFRGRRRAYVISTTVGWTLDCKLRFLRQCLSRPGRQGMGAFQRGH